HRSVFEGRRRHQHRRSGRPDFFSLRQRRAALALPRRDPLRKADRRSRGEVTRAALSRLYPPKRRAHGEGSTAGENGEKNRRPRRCSGLGACLGRSSRPSASPNSGRAVIQTIPIERSYSLSDYEKNVQLTRAVLDLRTEAAALVPRLSGRKVWMVNSAAHGGGVAEMLPKLVSLLRQVGVDCEWVVMATDQAEFFGLTKQLHNLIHGAGEPVVNGHQQQLYRRVSGALAREMLPMLAPDDILVCHDPQPAGMGALIKQQLGLPAIWRCHIGLDETTQQTEAAWQFLEPYVTAYDHAVFSAPEYLPRYLTNKVSIIHPSLDPLSFKNRELTPHMVAGVLTCAGLIEPRHPVSTPPFERKAERLQPDGSFGPADRPEEIGLLFRTIVTQISRWDRLKGWQPLLEAF